MPRHVETTYPAGADRSPQETAAYAARVVYPGRVVDVTVVSVVTDVSGKRVTTYDVEFPDTKAWPPVLETKTGG